MRQASSSRSGDPQAPAPTRRRAGRSPRRPARVDRVGEVVGDGQREAPSVAHGSPTRVAASGSGVAAASSAAARTATAAGTPSRTAAASGASGSVDDELVVLHPQQRRACAPPPRREARAGQPASNAAAASRTGLRRSSSAISSNGSSSSDSPFAERLHERRTVLPRLLGQRRREQLARAPPARCGAAAQQREPLRAARRPRPPRHRPRPCTNAQRGARARQPAPERPGGRARRRVQRGLARHVVEQRRDELRRRRSPRRAVSSSHSGSSDGNVPSSIDLQPPRGATAAARRPGRRHGLDPRPRDAPARRATVHAAAAPSSRSSASRAASMSASPAGEPSGTRASTGRRSVPINAAATSSSQLMVQRMCPQCRPQDNSEHAPRSQVGPQPDLVSPVPSSTRSAPSGVNPKRA